jgi:hypothetical protein
MGADIADTWSSVRPAGGAVCVDTPHKSQQYLRVLSAGGNAGRVDELTTPGRRTLRLVRTAGDVDDAVLVAIARYDSPQGCEELTAGAYGTREGADVTIAPGQVAACLTFPREELLLTNSFAWERTGGAGQVDVRVGNEVDRACRPPWSEEPQDPRTPSTSTARRPAATSATTRASPS